ncbi:U1 snRNP-associated protein Usp105 [Schizosaccharomyces octosporus yFS286]|uniref:U1 snRNP-associated protein Usp105 n=1 Tax=Schizosaccharomyces octosporus (strain yFS286) TaxID=483514 RepID=S9PUH4_SCHOY|nr:U1 snRNP-associated protein Usp105 [Schizosaccharomyces octosporus yFS286]EPX71602.1 U1 snRNP-associated protein Usp105 [Schizosaccharomyces octosporus yFS286]
MDYGDIYIAEETEWDKLNRQVTKNPDDFDVWEALIRATETIEGGIDRNSSKQTINTLRSVYDRFLTKFPLLFGYWKKYADFEFFVAGPEASEKVYERGIAGIPYSVDLWANYCSFKMETNHDPNEVREVFVQGSEMIGLDFLSHPFWDKYIEFEERQERTDFVYQILERLVHIPLHQYARYFERFVQVSQSQPLQLLLPPDVLGSIRADVLREPPEVVSAGSKQITVERGELEIEREIRARIYNIHLQIFQKTQVEVAKRWTFESEIKRPYFHVKELDEPQLVNWRKYLDFEEIEGDFSRIYYLYEKCLVACAFYDEFWFRFARWMLSQPGHTEDVRIIYERAACIFASISRPGIRLQYALFEESLGNIASARAIYQAILTQLPGNLEAALGWANLERRVSGDAGLTNAHAVLRSIINEGGCDPGTAAILITEDIKLVWKVEGNSELARSKFSQNAAAMLDSRYFWISYLRFELEQPLTLENGNDHYSRVSAVMKYIRLYTRLAPRTVMDLTKIYMEYLNYRSTSPNAVSEYLSLDRETFGPFSVRETHWKKLVEGEDTKQVSAKLLSVNGHPGIDVNDAKIKAGESPYEKYYRSQGVTETVPANFLPNGTVAPATIPYMQ